MITDIATGEAQDKAPPEKAEGQRKGGLKGAKARAASLTPRERSSIAKKAAIARWRKDSVEGD